MSRDTDRWTARCGCVFVGLAVARLCTRHVNRLDEVPDAVQDRSQSISGGYRALDVDRGIGCWPPVGER